MLLTTLYPVLHIASMFSDDALMGNRVTFFPINFNLRAYQLIFSSPLIPNSFKNGEWWARREHAADHHHAPSPSAAGAAARSPPR